MRCANCIGVFVAGLLAVAAPFLPIWLVYLAVVAAATGLAVLGLIVLWRTGLVSFGQALYFATGAYTVALLSRTGALSDAVLLILLAAVAGGTLAFGLGFLLARYREIFFAMLSLALSMILYALLVNSSALGSTDGIGVVRATFFGLAPQGPGYILALFWLAVALTVAAALLVDRYFESVAGALAVPVASNEIRVEYLGVSARTLVHVKLVIAGTLAGAGGGLVALAVAHVDPVVAYWTTSGGFVFVAILAGPGSVWGAFAGALLFESARSVAMSVVPGAWQLLLGTVLLLTIYFIPGGIGSLLFGRAGPGADKA